MELDAAPPGLNAIDLLLVGELHRLRVDVQDHLQAYGQDARRLVRSEHVKDHRLLTALGVLGR